MLRSLERLKVYADRYNINVYLVMTPDIHDINNYKFRNIHKIMQKVALEKEFISKGNYDSLVKWKSAV